MRTVYAVQFDVAQKDGLQTTTFDELIRLSLEWCRGYYQRKGLDLEPVPTGHPTTPMAGHTILPTHNDCSDGSVLWQLVWRYPSDEDPTALWRSEVTLAQALGKVQVAVVLRLESSSHVVAPFHYALGRPRLVGELAEQFACSVGGRELTRASNPLDSEDVPGFVVDVLNSESRSLPVVFVTPTGYDGPPLFPADQLADNLVGLAEVYAAEDRDATWALTDALGREFSCFNGAVRTYWPGFGRRSDPYAHPLLLPSRIAEIGDLAKWMLRSLAGVSALRFVEGDAIRHARAQMREENRCRIDGLRESASRGTAGMEEYRQLFEVADRENMELRTRQVELQDEVELLRSEVERLEQAHHDNTIAMTQTTAAYPSIADLDRETQQGEPKTVLEALERAESEHRDVFVVHQKAKRSARKSDYRSPARAQEVLGIIADVYRRKPGGLGRSLQAEFVAKGLEHKPRISPSTGGQYGSQYTCQYGAQSYCIGDHVTLRGRPNEGTLCVHWAELEDGRVLIGHVGAHLDYATGS